MWHDFIYGVWILYVLRFPSSSTVVVAALYEAVWPLTVWSSPSAVDKKPVDFVRPSESNWKKNINNSICEWNNRFQNVSSFFLTQLTSDCDDHLELFSHDLVRLPADGSAIKLALPKSTVEAALYPLWPWIFCACKRAKRSDSLI